MESEPRHELVEVHTDGSFTRHPISPEEADGLHARFLEVFDPDTLIPLSHLRYLRSHGIVPVGYPKGDKPT
ncbi:MAG: hypothetical protein AB9869_00625 [Verrucomicrobiia bacterium]